MTIIIVATLGVIGSGFMGYVSGLMAGREKFTEEGYQAGIEDRKRVYYDGYQAGLKERAILEELKKEKLDADFFTGRLD